MIAIVKIVPWLIGGGWRYAAGATRVVAVLGAFAATWGHGYRTAADKCEAAALKAQIEKVTRERDTAAALSTAAGATVASLQEQDTKAQERLRDLQLELDAIRNAPPPKDGKPDARAFVDARCGLTPRGVRELSR